jgi:hypothetical protein
VFRGEGRGAERGGGGFHEKTYVGGKESFKCSIQIFPFDAEKRKKRSGNNAGPSLDLFTLALGMISVIVII